MLAYAALLSLKRSLKTLIYSEPLLYEEVASMKDFLRDASTRREIHAPELEIEMREAAYKAKNLIEYQILNRSIINEDMILIICLFVSFSIAFSILCYKKSFEGFVYVPLQVQISSLTIGMLTLLIEIANSEALTEVIYDFKDFYQTTRECRFNPRMRADAALKSLLHVVDSILAPNELRISQSERDNLESLHKMANSLLGNVSSDTTELQGIRDASYQAEKAIVQLRHYKMLTKWPLVVLPSIAACLLTMFALIERRSVYFWGNALLGVISACIILFSVMGQWYSKAPNHQRLAQVMDDLSVVVRDVMKNKDACRRQSELPAAASSKPDLGGSGRTRVVVGLDNDLKEIKDRMLDNGSERKIVSIMGMGGIGKTTLATQVYNDPYILHHFEIRAWVKVSREYSLLDVLLSLLESADMLTQEIKQHDDCELGTDLHKILTEKRYLVVMDDVWDPQIWDDIRGYFPENNNGSCVLLTSRMSNVNSYRDSLHQMQFLKEDDSWLLLHQLVFGAEGCPFELESVGREVARDCRGLPLVISVVGGLLYKDNRIEIWREVADKLKHSQSSEIKEQCLEILGLSYNHLPHYLRPCFLYMGAFPRDRKIPVSRLINLWIAEGFLPQRTSTNFEELGELYLKDLIDRNLIMVCDLSCTGKIKTCNIHDALRDLCVQHAKEENFLHVVNSEGYETRGRPGETRNRLSIHADARHVNARDNLMSTYQFLRSLLCISGKPIKDRKIDVYLGLKYLRVLDVLEVHFDEFPHQIVKLGLLRYLAFHYDGPFPPSISKLKNLETIVHHHCPIGKYPLYPMLIWSLPNLRHLYVKPGYHFSQILWSFGFLVRLQTLVGVNNMKWSQSMVRRIPNLKKLVISYDVSSPVDWSHYQLECLVELHQLESLKIAMESDISNDRPKLAFPHNLKKLSLSGCGIPWTSMACIGALPKLEALKLRRESFHGHSWETVEGQFQQLTFLLLEEMNFASWKTDEKHFPRLRRLVIRSCGALKEFPSTLGDIPTLEMIQLINCHPSAVHSARLMLEEQESNGNEDLKLHILN